MPQFESFPIRTIKPEERDPLRNFRFRVDFVGNESVRGPYASMGFISVGGIGIQTDMIPYREGGDNTITRKMPGQSDVGPLQLIGGMFMEPVSAGYEWFKHVFSVISGQGNTGYNENFRCDLIVSILKHPVTKYSPGGVGDPRSPQSAGAAIKFYNCWPGSFQINDLNAGDNSIMVNTIAVHHEGFDIRTGPNAAATFNP